MIDRPSIRRVSTLLLSLAFAGCVASSGSQTPAHATALDACRAAGSTAQLVAVEVDRANLSALALTAGAQIATCWAYRDGAGFGSASVGSGFYPVSSPATLSYLTGQEAGREAFHVGRYPPGTSKVRVTFVDGTIQEAAIGSGVWLVWVSSTSKPATIEALDASGAPLARLANPNGIEPTTG